MLRRLKERLSRLAREISTDEPVLYRFVDVELGRISDWWGSFAPKPPPNTQAVRATLTIKQGETVTTTINIDTTDGVASLVFEDRLNEATTAPLSADGVTPGVVQYTADNPAVATIDPNSGAITAVGAGAVNFGATVNDAATGAPLVESDGTTPFAPAPVAVTVDPGAAVGDVFTVTP